MLNRFEINAECTMSRSDNDSSSDKQRNRPKRSPLWYPEETQPSRRQWLLFVWIALAIVLLFHYLDSAQRHQQVELTYSEFLTAVDQGHIDSVTLRGQAVEGTFSDSGRQARELGDTEEGFEATRPDVEGERLLERLEANGVRIDAEPIDPPWWQRVLVGALPWILILGLLFWFWNRMQQRAMSGGGMFNMGKSSARQVSSEESEVRLDDVAGSENAKREVIEVIDFLKEPARFQALGAKIPRGILMMGPPGTGKTLMAKAVAGEADVPFFSISGSEFIEMFVGVGASRVRDMFKSAKENAPSIIFIDEIDSVGRARGTGVGGGHDEREQTLNQILGEMDGFEPHEEVVVLAATNRPDVLDRALLRPGRFDRKVTLDLPDRRARKAILEIHTANMPLADDVDLERLAALTVTFSGADIENLVNEAALLAGREKREEIDMQSLLAARDKVVLGGKREMLIEDEEKKLIACHEAGHAVAATFLEHADPLDKVTIIPRGRALGATEQIPDEERHNLPEDYLRDRIGVMLGGRVAEQLVYGQVTSGSAQDLKQATGLARRMVSQWGMSEKLGAAAFSRGEEHVFLGKEMAQERNFSEHTARIIDDEICSLVSAIEESVQAIMQDKRERLEALTCALVDDETLEAEAVEEILRG